MTPPFNVKTEPLVPPSTLPILLLLLATAWSANHFAALLPVLRQQENLSAGLLAGVYALYAVGLLPGLLAGGTVSDRIGRPAVALPGAALTLTGTICLLFWQDPTGLTIGRLIIGLGAGATFSAGTAWAADLAGATGATQAGLALTIGLAVAPAVTGVLAQWFPAPLTAPFIVSAALSLFAILLTLRRLLHLHLHAIRPATQLAVPTVDRSPGGPRTGRSISAALGWSLPIAPWVFAAATVGLVTLPSRMPTTTGGPLLVGVAGAVVFGSGLLAQTVARQRQAGPAAGTLGAAAAAGGLALAGIGGNALPIPLAVVTFVLLGIGYGLCLRAGLLDLTIWGPPEHRGTLTGLFYLVTYLGFGVPPLLEAIRPTVGAATPLLALASLAWLSALSRWWRLRKSQATQ
jgi:MFS family permease